MPLDAAEAFLRIGAAGGCGALIGLERESRNQLAGMRTHALVAAGAAIFTLAGAHGFPDMARGPNVDPMRVAAQIASAIAQVVPCTCAVSRSKDGIVFIKNNLIERNEIPVVTVSCKEIALDRLAERLDLVRAVRSLIRWCTVSFSAQ